MVVRSRLDTLGGEPTWEFGPFGFAAGEPLCSNEPDMCNWSFSTRNLEISTADDQWSLALQSRAHVDLTDVSCGIFHRYIFDRASTAEESCATAHARRQNFALVRVPPSTTDP